MNLHQTERLTLRGDAGIGYAWSRTDRFTERNPALMQGLRIDQQRTSSAVGDLGLHADYAASTRLQVQGALHLYADFGGSERTVDASFIEVPGRLRVTAPGLGSVTGAARLGLRYAAADRVQLGLDGGLGITDKGVGSGDISAQVSYRF